MKARKKKRSTLVLLRRKIAQKRRNSSCKLFGQPINRESLTFEEIEAIPSIEKELNE